MTFSIELLQCEVFIWFQAHLCDCHLENGVDVVEVGTLSPGDDITTFRIHGFKCGIAICYDGCFDEFIKLYGRAGINAITNISRDYFFQSNFECENFIYVI